MVVLSKLVFMSSIQHNGHRLRAGSSLGMVFGVAVVALLTLTLSSVAFRYLIPLSPGPSSISNIRFQWYVQSAQWKADVRTLISVAEVLAARPAESDTTFQLSPS